MLSSLYSWINDEALDTWATRGFDADRDLFHERLDLVGAPLPVPYRAMVQARQIYVFSHAAVLGHGTTGELANRAMRQLQLLFGTSSGGETSFAFSIDAATGRSISSVRDSYTHAFVLLAIAFLYRATGDAALVSLAREVSRFVEQHLTDQTHGGVLDALPQPTPPVKRQNPQMHLLEAYLALAEAMPGEGYLELASPLIALFRRHLFDSEGGVLLEHFGPQWGMHHDPSRSRVFEPGHHYEWVWLLEQFQRLSGEDVSPERDALWRTARESGHASTGLIYDEVGTDRAVVLAGHRLWPHTEAIKAAATRHRAGDGTALPFAQQMAALLLERFLAAPFTGGWIDHLRSDLTPQVGYVPASSLYHLFLASAEARSTFGDSVADDESAPAVAGSSEAESSFG